jgi:ribosomal 50S subunit-associated protein YjgA (DUF615 family)
MQDITAITDALTAQSARHTQEMAALHRAEAARSAAFEHEMARHQAERADVNALRDQMTNVMSDIMTVLKKTGDQIRQSS